ncbi:alpha/beta hydrolase [Sphingoaurantiacus capsulatus]|uniref:Alpha/beta hydrolase n=1 Tax=Sphingoaurantiacus capsulatus TaxID=1771310 RepID=A0ABV7XA57_9SPHN
MIRAAFIALLLATPAAVAAQVTPVPDAPVLHRTSIFDMKSDTGRTFRIFVAEPKIAPPPGGYPVFYVLDGNWMFATATDTIRALERRPGGSPAIVVGIGYPEGAEVNKERALDLTPRLGSPEPKQPGTGNAEAFMRFIETKLKPEIDKRYDINAARETLFGHSFGGLFTLYALINKPTLFDNWVAASPSIWFEDKLMQKGNVRRRLAPKLGVTGATPRVLITAGEFEQAADPDFPPGRVEVLLERKQIDNGREFAEFLQQPGVTAKFELLAGEDHGTVIPVAISRGVRWAASDAKRPAPAPKAAPYVNKTGVKIPTVEDYVKLTPEQRYELRIRSRKISPALHPSWVAEFDRTLGAGLTYGEHRALAEEREAMDKKHGTKPID